MLAKLSAENKSYKESMITCLPMPVISSGDVEQITSGSSIIKVWQMAEWSKANPANVSSGSRIIKAQTPAVTEVAKHHSDQIESQLSEKINAEMFKAFGTRLEVRQLADLVRKTVVKTVVDVDVLLRCIANTSCEDMDDAKPIEIIGLGSLVLAINRIEGQESSSENFCSLFVGEGLEPWVFDKERKARNSARGIIQKIISGDDVLLKNVELFFAAIESGQITRL